MTVDEAKVMRDLAAILRLTEVPDAAGDDAAARVAPDGTPATVATESERAAVLEQLRDLVESMDTAKNLFVVGGYGPALDALARSSSVRVRAAAANLVATVVQNNPKAQAWALAASTLPCLAATLAVAAGEYAQLTTGGAHPAPAAAAEQDDAAASAAAAASAPQLAAAAPSSASAVMPTPLSRPPFAAVGDGDAPAAAAAEWPTDVLRLWAAALMALSALVRDNVEAQADLVASGALELLLQPLRQWRQLAAGGAGDRAGVAPLPPAAVTQGRRLLRRCLFAVRHLVEGAQADAVKHALLMPAPAAAAAALGGHVGGTATDLAALLSLGALTQLPGNADEDPDVAAIRDSALAVVASVASPSPVGVTTVVDDTDGRSLSGMQVGQRAREQQQQQQQDEAQQQQPPAPLLLLGDAPAALALAPPSGSSGASSSAPAAEAAPPPGRGAAYLTLPQRRAALIAAPADGGASVATALVKHRGWCVTRAEELERAAAATADGDLRDEHAAAAAALRDEAGVAEAALRQVLARR
jgi:trimeric autotransporter adhesin